MLTMAFYLAPLRNDRRAVTALEYGLIAAAVVVVGMAGFNILGTDLAIIFSNVRSALT